MNAGPSNEPTVTITLATIYSKLLDIDKKVDPLPRQVEDHEGRIRSLERQIWAWVGLASMTSGGLASLVTKLVTS